MPKSHARQRRPLFPVAWTVKGLADSLTLDPGVIYRALAAGELVAHRIGIKRLILTESVVAWIKSQPKG
jgi:excisionase family DNA binding protein